MKKLLIILFALAGLQNVKAQSPEEIHKAILDKVVSLYNTGDYKTIYAMLSPEFKTQVPEQELTGFLSYQQATHGKIQNKEYLYDREGFKVYKATFDKGTFNLILACSNQWLITGFAITPYKAPPTSTPPTMPTTNKKATPLDLEVDKAVAEFLENPKNPGLSIAVVTDGQTYFYHYGTTAIGDKQLPDNTTIYEMGSVTKTFTGILLAKALEDKKLSLYDDVRKFLPVKCSDLAQGNHPIILKHLANHTSGIPRIPQNLDQQPYYDPANPYKNYNSEMLYDYLSTLQLAVTPGLEQEYSNTGSGLLGLILEKTYETDFEKLVTSYICKPLKMSATFVKVPEKQKAKLATGYYDGKPNPYWDFADIQGFGALKSTINDMALYLKGNIDNATPYIQFSHESTFKKDDLSTALCWFIGKTKSGDSLLWHNGGTFGFSSYLGYLKNKKCGVVVLGNSFTNGELDIIGTDILRFLQGQ